MTHPNRPEKIAAILALISSGKSLRKACEQEGVPPSTMSRWIEEEGISEQYARAMEGRADAVFEDIIEIADNPDPNADVQRDKLRVDTRKWAVARMAPRKYGDRLDLNHGGDMKVVISSKDAGVL